MAKSLDEGFKTFISWLQPLQTEHDKGASHKGSVKSCMETNFGCTSIFETGSFGNGTGVRHYSDTDYFAICPSANFYNNSGTTLTKVKEALAYTFSRTSGIVVKKPAVRIPFGTYASERLELTPAYFNSLVSTPVGNKYSYNIPNYDDGWMQSSPGAHIDYVNREDKRLGGKLKPLIQMVKAWKFYNQIPIYSFYLELRVTKYAEGESLIVYDIDLKNFFKFLDDNSLPSIQDPMGISGMVRACKTDAKKASALSKVTTAATRTQKAYDEKDKNLDNTFYYLDLLFNGQFPAR